MVGGVSWLMAAAIAAFRPGDISARYVLLSGDRRTGARVVIRLPASA